MRKTFVKTLLELCNAHEELMLVTADLGYAVFEQFYASKPKSYLNVGVAEADMIGVSAGLATCGRRPIAYSITPFISIRCLEQVRVDVCYHNLPIMLVGTGAGLCYGTLGPTHHGTEDLSLMRSLPNMTVTAPADKWELEHLFKQGFELSAPFYMRIGRAVEPEVHTGQKKPQIKLGKGAVVREEGSDFAIIATGNAVYSGLQALQKLSGAGHKGKLISMHTIKPLDTELVGKLGNSMPLFTLEEHSIVGGLGSAVAEFLADAGIRPDSFARIALPDAFQKKVGSHDFLRWQSGIDADSVAAKIKAKLEGKK